MLFTYKKADADGLGIMTDKLDMATSSIVSCRHNNFCAMKKDNCKAAETDDDGKFCLEFAQITKAAGFDPAFNTGATAFACADIRHKATGTMGFVPSTKKCKGVTPNTETKEWWTQRTKKSLKAVCPVGYEGNVVLTCTDGAAAN